MSFASQNSAQAYARVGVETGVTAANPHQLILMLFEGALLAIAKADASMKQGAIIEKSQAISRATDIISSGLRASLDFSGGDDLAMRLASLYDYMVLRLIHANVKNDTGALHEVSGLLTEIRSAWEEIADDPAVLSSTKAAA
jgi:flagellar protein FliS